MIENYSGSCEITIVSEDTHAHDTIDFSAANVLEEDVDKVRDFISQIKKHLYEKVEGGKASYWLAGDKESQFTLDLGCVRVVSGVRLVFLFLFIVLFVVIFLFLVLFLVNPFHPISLSLTWIYDIPYIGCLNIMIIL